MTSGKIAYRSVSVRFKYLDILYVVNVKVTDQDKSSLKYLKQKIGRSTVVFDKQIFFQCSVMSNMLVAPY